MIAEVGSKFGPPVARALEDAIRSEHPELLAGRPAERQDAVIEGEDVEVIRRKFHPER
jgi:hypothetical protein